MKVPDWERVSAWAAILLIAGILILFGLVQWPGLHFDANLYATPVLNVANGKGWNFGGYTPQLTMRSTEVFSSHGVLHIEIFGNLLRASTWEKLFFWCGLVNAATFIAWTFVFQRTLRRSGHSGLLRPILFGAMAGVIALGLQGRPEHLALLLISLPLVLRELSVPTRVFQLAEYALIGLLFTLSPASGVLYGMGVVYWLSFKFENINNRLLWREFFVAGLMATVAMVTVVGLFCPFSIREWIENVLFVSGAHFDMSWHLFSFNLDDLRGDSMDAPLWNVVVLSVAGLSAFLLLWRRKLVGFIIFSMLAIFCYRKLTDYGYVSLFPLIFLFLISRNETSDPYLARPAVKRIFLVVGSTIASLYVLALVRVVLIAVVYGQQGVSLADTRQKLNELGVFGLENDQAVAFNSLTTPSFIVFGDGGNRFVSGEAARIHETWRDEHLVKYEEKYQRQIEYFVYPQSYPGQPPDELYVGHGRFARVYNNWKDERPRFLGFKLGGRMPGYQFALYQRMEKSELAREN